MCSPASAMGNTHSADFGRAFKEKEMKNRFIGDTRIPSFKDGSSIIDLSNYSETVMPEYRGFKFLYITVMDISQYTITSDFYKDLEQWGIRHDDGNEDAKQEMQDSYIRLDWDVEQGPPPQFTAQADGTITAGDAINGRRRIRGAIERGVKFIPVAVYEADEELSDEEVYQCRVEAAQNANDLIGSVRYNGKDDYIMTGVSFVRDGIIGGDSAAVLAWLEDRMNYKERFLSSSTQKEIFNKIIEWGNANYDLTTYMDGPIADAWCQEHGHKVKDSNGHFDKKLHIVCVDNTKYADRLMAYHIIPACLAVQPQHPIRIIGYSKKRKPLDIKKNTKSFADAIEDAYKNCFKLVEVMLGGALTLNVPEYRPWVIEGCIPQIQGEQDVDGSELIPYEKVIASLPKKKKKTEVTDFMEIDKALNIAA